MVRAASLLPVLFAACYRPPGEAACSVACETSCPGSLQCGTDRRCHEPGEPECTDGGITTADARVVVDARFIDAPSGGEICAGSGQGFLNLCYSGWPTELQIDAQTTIDTDDDSQCTFFVATTTPISHCVVAADSIRINAPVRARGKRGLVLWSATDIMIAGIIDVSSQGANVGGRGAGANAPSCVASDGQNSSTSNNGGGASGGGGGSFGSIGGYGGDTPSQSGTVPSSIPTTYEFQGGCAGGQGGTNDTSLGGAGGSGGGSMYLTAHGTITVNGHLYAYGGGGATAHAQGGGGGGGSGGMIILDAPTVTTSATTLLLATGGSGASGGGNSFDGNPGQEATPVAFPPRVPGPSYAGYGGAGSNPSYAESGGTSTMDMAGINGGGGGGGGGGGYNRVFGDASANAAEARPPFVQ